MAFTPRTETYVNVASLTTPFNITVTKPTGAVDGDILFCWMGWYAAVTIDAVPSGWNLLGEYTANTDRYALYYKIASGEGANWVWSFTATAKVRAVCSCYTGGDFNSADPIDVVSNTAYRTSNKTVQAASMNVARVNSPLLFWGGSYKTTTITFTKPSVPTTDWVEDDDAGHLDPDLWTGINSMIWSGSGTTADMDSAIGSNIATKHGFAVALKPRPLTLNDFSTPIKTHWELHLNQTKISTPSLASEVNTMLAGGYLPYIKHPINVHDWLEFSSMRTEIEAEGWP